MRHPRLHRLLLAAAAAAGFCVVMSAQVLVVDRGVPPGGSTTAPPRDTVLRAAWTSEPDRFVGDEFSVGVAGEVWFIDNLRTWVLVDDTPGPLFDKLTLYGGMAGQPLTKDQADCACHSTMAIKTAVVSANSDVSVSPSADQPPNGYHEEGRTFRLWQIEFRNVRWSVPGGVGLQFAVKPETSHAWFNYASPVQVAHRLRVFDTDGQLRSFLGGDENGINLQVWGHLSAKVAIRRAGGMLEAVLSGGPTFDVSQVETAGLRLGPITAGPVNATVEDADGDGIPDLKAAFRESPTGPQATVSVCLTGKRVDGVPFEGCDLLPPPKK